MFVFGDDGFVLPKKSAVSGPALAAGAKPDEVIVPGQASRAELWTFNPEP